MQLEEKRSYPGNVVQEAPDSSEVDVKITYEMGCKRIDHRADSMQRPHPPPEHDKSGFWKGK